MRLTLKRRRLVASELIALLGVIFGLLWLDLRYGLGVRTHDAAVFGFIVAALATVGEAAQIVYDGIQIGIDAAIGWLAATVGWLSSRLIDLFVSTGAVFSKTWDALRALWANVVEPVVWEIDSWYEKLRGWLSRVLEPLVEWAQRVRDELKAIYRQFVRPILDTIDTARHILDILARLHVPFAATLDQYLTEAEQWFVSEWLRLSGYVNRILDTLDGLLTFDGLLQRFVFIRTLERDIFWTWRALMNSRRRGLTADEAEWTRRAGETQTVKECVSDVVAFWDGEDTDATAGTQSLSSDFSRYWDDDLAA